MLCGLPAQYRLNCHKPKMNSAVLGIGSNIRPHYNVTAAKHRIAKHFSIVRESEFVTTSPIGFKEQPDFINGAVLIHTEDDFDTVNATLHSIEKSLGRARGPNKYGPRTVDIDILIWNNKVVNNTVFERDFLKRSITQILPTIKLK